jgi:hypothetical protein
VLTFGKKLSVLSIIDPCLVAARHATRPLVHHVLRAVRHAGSGIGRQGTHLVRHAGRAVGAHARRAVSVACNAAPGALAVGMLALPLPVIGPEQVPLGGAVPLPKAAEMARPMMGFVPGFGPFQPATPDAGSIIVTFLPPEDVPAVNPGTLPGAGDSPPPLQNISPSIPGAPPHSNFPISSDPGQPVPEPSSVLVLASALSGLSLLRWRTRRSS